MFKVVILALAVLSVSANSGFLKVLDDNSDVKLFLANLRNPAHYNLTDVFETFDGFSTTVGLYSEMPSFEKCKVNDAHLVTHLVDVVEDIALKEFTDLIEDSKALMDTIYEIYKQCDSVGFYNQLLQTLGDIQANFSQPDYAKKLMANLQSNIFVIMAELKNVMDNFNNQKFNDFGKGLGSLLRTILLVK
jgi:hypothetical protein